MEKGFDNELYVKYQTETILKRIEMFDKLYLEFGGKLLDDYHAKRILPGFELDAKISLLEKLKEKCEVILCINAKDIEKKKIRADYGTTYDYEIIRLIKKFNELNIPVNSVVITLFNNQESVKCFQEKLNTLGVKTYIHTPTKGYPTDVDTIVSEEGYGANPYIKTTKPLVVVTAPGPCSGKLATCLSQLYHEHKNGIKAGYAKFETFPVWNLPLKHPVNMAYEAATADLNDKNMIDYFHLEKYGISTVNYNRDLEIFPVVKDILYKITNTDIYSSPTDMGVNSIGNCIINDEIIKTAANKEIIRRYYKALCDVKTNSIDEEIPKRIKLLLNELQIDNSIRPVINTANETYLKSNRSCIAIELNNKKIITGKQTQLLSPASSLILNAIKELTNIPDDVDLLSPTILEPIINYKNKVEDKTLNLQELIITLAICSVTNPIVKKALNNIKKLENCDAHASHILKQSDYDALKSLKINITCEPKFIKD